MSHVISNKYKKAMVHYKKKKKKITVNLEHDPSYFNEKNQKSMFLLLTTESHQQIH